jgi:hypothetical protein
VELVVIQKTEAKGREKALKGENPRKEIAEKTRKFECEEGINQCP